MTLFGWYGWAQVHRERGNIRRAHSKAPAAGSNSAATLPSPLSSLGAASSSSAIAGHGGAGGGGGGGGAMAVEAATDMLALMLAERLGESLVALLPPCVCVSLSGCESACLRALAPPGCAIVSPY